mgnify:FL=1
MCDVDSSNVLSWTERPRRARKPPPASYWEEYVETDDWYLKKLLEDVPASELHAACFDDDVENDAPCSSQESGSDSSTEDDESFVDASGSDGPSDDEDTSSDSGSTTSSAAVSDATRYEHDYERLRGSDAEDSA